MALEEVQGQRWAGVGTQQEARSLGRPSRMEEERSLEATESGGVKKEGVDRVTELGPRVGKRPAWWGHSVLQAVDGYRGSGRERCRRGKQSAGRRL